MAKVLVVIPHDRFRDEELTTILNVLRSKGHEAIIGSSHSSEAQGHFGLLVKPDINISFVEPYDYDGIVFIGGRGIDEYVNNGRMITLVRNFFAESKLIGAIGHAVEILIYSGIISGRRVTTDVGTIPKVQGAGGYYTGGLVEEDGFLITASGVEAKDEFAKVISAAVEWKGQNGEIYARASRS